MNKKNSNYPKDNKDFDKEFEQERKAAQQTFSEEDRKNFWKTLNNSENRKPNISSKKDQSKGKKDTDTKRSFGKKSFSDDRERADNRFDRDKKPYQKREGAADYNKKSFDKKPFSDNRERADNRFDRDKKPYQKREGATDYNKKSFDKKPFGDNRHKNDNSSEGEHKTFPKKDRKPFEKNYKIENVRKFPEKTKSKFDKSEAKTTTKTSRHKDRFIQHFDYENPLEKAYDTTGNKGTLPDVKSVIDTIHEMPLNKFIAHCGICSRRDAVGLIKEKKVLVNDKIIEEPGYKIDANDIVKLEGKIIKVQKNMVYLLLNKPKGFITTTDDPKGRRTVMDIFGDNLDERVFPVGRLDRNTTGLLLLTNDGDIAQQLSHPKYENRKIYQVTLDKNVSTQDFEKILKGVVLEDGSAKVDQLAYLEQKNEIGLEIHSGKNRIVRRIFESLGYVVEKLDRVMYAGLTKKNLKRGQWRYLSKQEIINLKHLNKNKKE